MKNKIFNEYLENEYNKNEIYNSICVKIKNKDQLKKKTLLNIAAILIGIIILGTTGSSLYARKNWQKEYKEYLNRNISVSKSIIDLEAIEGCKENLNMEYVYQDGIGVKINSLLISDYTCQIYIDFKITDKNKKDYKAFEFGFAIYDEENNIYNISERMKFGVGKHLHYEEKICKELGVKYNASRGIPKQLTPKTGLDLVSMQEENNTMRLELKSAEKLPKSKKLYIRIFDIGYALEDFSFGDSTELIINDAQDFQISNCEWQFEIEIPERFYDKRYTELKLSEDINGIELEKAIISSENTLSIIVNTKYSSIDIMKGMYISDEFENVYPIYSMSDDNKLKLVYHLEKDILDKKLYLNLNIPEHNINKNVELVEEEI